MVFNFRRIIRLTSSINFDRQFEDGLSVSDSLCTAAPFSQKKSEKGCLWGRGTTVHRLVSDGWSISGSCVKTANNKMPVSSVFNDSEGLYRTTVCRCLVCGPHYSARQMRFWWRVRASFFSQIRHWDTLTETAWEHDVQGLGMAMSAVASKRNRELLFTGNVLYKQWHLCVLFH